MKKVLIPLLVFLTTLFFISTTLAMVKEDATSRFIHTNTQILDFFEKYSPQDVVDYARIAAGVISEIGQEASSLPKEKEEQLIGAYLNKFQSKKLKFVYSEKFFHPITNVIRCDEWRVVAHPIKPFFNAMRSNGFLRKYKDVRGKKTALELCEKVKRLPKGAWSIQYQWWPLTDKPVWMGLLFVQVPNSPYQLISFYPTRKYTKEQLQQAIK